MKIDSETLEKALKTLKTVLLFEKDDNDIIRDSAIKRFQYTYELSFKLLRKKLVEWSESAEKVEHMPYEDMVLFAAQKELIDNSNNWLEFRKRRNSLSHDYNEPEADSTYDRLKQFVESAEYLLSNIKRLESLKVDENNENRPS